MKDRNPAIVGISTAVPEYSYTQSRALELALNILGDSEEKRHFLERIYEGSAISKRHAVVSDFASPPEQRRLYPASEDLRPEPELKARNELFIEEAPRLAHKAAAPLLEGAIAPDSITHLITVSCTGFSAPGVDQSLVESLGLSATVHRLHIGFMGCYGSFPALRTAGDICRSHDDARVLVVAVELCSLHTQFRFDLDLQVANAIFADGAGAALVSSLKQDLAKRHFLLRSFHTRILPESRDGMSWQIGEVAFDMRLATYVPRVIGSSLKAVMADLEEETGISPKEIVLWAFHPGGKAILDRIARALSLRSSALEHSWKVLDSYGNMSSATTLFVLKSILESEDRGLTFAAGFGPGLTLEAAFLECEG